MPSSIARRLRRTSTIPERVLWKALRRVEAKWRRQHPIGPYVVDFFCRRSRLVIELDGTSHSSAEALERDEVRDAWLKARGIRVLRVTNGELARDPQGVLATISSKM